MAVYIDNASLAFGRMKMSHMVADTPDELHAMADRIGIARRWYQTPDGPKRASFPHYDVSKAYREKALGAGAVAVDRRGLHEVMSRLRKQMIADPSFAASWSYLFA